MRIKPHHFLCILGFQGKGYSSIFVQNFRNLVEALEKNPQALLTVTFEEDEICGPCPNRREQSCATQEKITRLDQAHAKILGLAHEDKISWQDAKQRLRTSMTLEKFRKACTGCEWQALGYCETALRKLIEE